jgi:outer membrane protein assembly factor BamB
MAAMAILLLQTSGNGSGIAHAAGIGLPHGNIRRTGYSPVPLRPPYRLLWEHRFRDKPRPAWREPAWEPQRIDFDYAYAVATDGDHVYVASSADHGLHALDLETGQESWVFLTGGPVRLAPDFYRDRVLFTSDDGTLYCLTRKHGERVWTYRPEGVPDRRLIGNEQMISRWPGRSGVLVENDRLYVTFGMLSTEGVAVCCLDAETGKTLWINDTSGHRFMARPHLTAMGGVSPQGYLAVNESLLVVSCGRSTPALFDKQTGACRYHEADGDFTGGAWTMVTDRFVFTQADTLKKEYGSQLRRDHTGPEAPVFDLATLVALHPETGQEVFSLRGGSRGILCDKGGITLIGRDALIHVELPDILKAIPEEPGTIAHTLGHFVANEPIRRWATPVDRVYRLLQARDTIIAGGAGWLACFDAEQGKRLWKADVKGQIRSMCLAAERLVVSTTEGRLACFAPEIRAPGTPPAPARTGRAPSDEGRTARAKGYALALGSYKAGDLAALSREYDLLVHPTQGSRVQTLRRDLYHAGRYGTKVAVHEVAGPDLPYTDYFADAIHMTLESQETLTRLSLSEAYRLLRPCGGEATIRFPQNLALPLERALVQARIPATEIKRTAHGLSIIRGPLPGAGTWTHQYGDPGKRTASDEQRVRLPLKAAWFGGMGPQTILSRHFREPAPLVIDGRCFVPGTDHLTAMNIYNGRILWQREMPNLAHWPAAYRGPGLAVDQETVYALQERDCLLLDPRSGRTLARYPAPLEALNGNSKDVIWEYLAVCDHTLVGTLGVPNLRPSWWSRAYPVSTLLFALDKRSGKVLWMYRAREGLDSNALAIDDGKVCLIDGQPRYRFLKPREKVHTLQKRKLLALDLASGRTLWEHEDIVPTLNSLWLDRGVLLATQMPFSRSMQDRDAVQAGGGVTAYAANDGRPLWRIDEVETLTPVIIGDVFYSPDAYDLHTGQPVASLSQGNRQFSARMPMLCSTLAGCPSMVMARRSSLGFVDLHRQGGTFQYPVTRSSCWINMIPAGGLVVIPEGGSSCQCAYNYKTSMALMSDERHYDYGIGGTGLAGPPALRLNFGAPGDRPDPAGQMWFAYPRPVAHGRCLGSQPYGPKVADPRLPIRERSANQGVTAYGRNPDWVKIEGTDRPWLYACGLRGPLRISIDPTKAVPGTKTYRVTLFFCELDKTAPARPCAIKLQGETIGSLRDILGRTGNPRQAREQSFTVAADGDIEFELTPTAPGAPPIVSGLCIEAAGKEPRL